MITSNIPTISPIKPLLWLIGALILLLLTIAIAVTQGPAAITLSEFWLVIKTQCLGEEAIISQVRRNIILNGRFPRVLMAGCAGAGLALSGTILQSLTRNPLADPWLLGISSGASLGAIFISVIGFGGAMISLSLGAFIGALLAFACVILLAGRSLTGESHFLILAGVAIAQFFAALSSFITMRFADSDTTRGVMAWLLGSLSSTRWPEVSISFCILLLAFVICLWYAKELNAFAFGSNLAASLGVSVLSLKIILYITTTAITSVIVAFCGAIGFVGIIIPHLARMLIGYHHQYVLPLAALIGAIFMIFADTVARTAFPPQEIPVGVITALMGVPVFIWILYHQIRK